MPRHISIDEYHARSSARRRGNRHRVAISLTCMYGIRVSDAFDLRWDGDELRFSNCSLKVGRFNAHQLRRRVATFYCLMALRAATPARAQKPAPGTDTELGGA